MLHVTSERPLASLLTCTRWWEWLRACGAKWKKRSRVKWGAAEGSNGGKERKAWEALLEMDEVQLQLLKRWRERPLWSFTLRRLLRKCNSKRSGLGTSAFFKESFGCSAGASNSSEEYSLKGVWRVRYRLSQPASQYPRGRCYCCGL